MTEDGLVIVYTGGGKGKTTIEYMQSKGWQVVMNKYQVLLLHKDNL